MKQSQATVMAVPLLIMALSAMGEGATTSVAEVAGQADLQYGPLEDLTTSAGAPEAKKEWEARRKVIHQTLVLYLGDFPTSRTELKPRVISEHKMPGYTRRRVRYMTQPGEDVTAFLLVPDSVTSGSPAAAVMALHQTAPEGKEEVCGLAGKPAMHYGHELAMRGYVVLAPDSIAAGDRIYAGSEAFETAAFDITNPEWSALGKMAWDHMRGLDYLETLPFVDSSRIGVIGHSLGAYNAMFLAAFDARVKAVVQSCGYCTIASDLGRERWARTSWFVHAKRLRPYVVPGSTLKAPFDFHEVLAMAAPRPVFQSVGLADEIFPTSESAAQAHEAALEIYELYDAGHRLNTRLFNGPHDFADETRKEAYKFFDRWLLNETP